MASRMWCVALSFAVLFLGLAASAHGGSIYVSGYNADEIFGPTEGNTASAVTGDVDSSGSYWGASDAFGGSYWGLPAGGEYTTGAGVTYHFAPYAGNNALRLAGNGASGTVSVVEGQYSDVYVLATGANGGGSGDITLNFSDATSTTVTDGFIAPNWGMDQASNPARVNECFRVRPVGDGTYAFDTNAGYYMFESHVVLSAPDQAKTLTSITFTETYANPCGAYSSVYAVEGIAVPEPTSVAMVLTGLIGLLAYAWRKGR